MEEHRRKDMGCGMVVLAFTIVVALATTCAIRFIKQESEQWQEDYRRQEKSAYSGWVKMTGNPKNLTFEEWRELKRADLLKEK